MIPIRDDAPHSTIPFVNYFLIALNVLVYLLLLAPDFSGFEKAFAFVPFSVDAWIAGSAPAAAVFVPLISSTFLHAGFLHLLFNMWALAIFGDNVEDRLGHFGYLVFYLACGLGASLTHLIFNLHSRVPTVGASGAIAGVMGAYFLLFPSARVLTWFGFFILWLPAWLVLGYWFIAQFVSGAASTISNPQRGGQIAFWAHVGGFLTGLLLIKILPVRRAAYSYDE